jgi:pimeloyl-ACP methyl ester carboxylesterase
MLGMYLSLIDKRLKNEALDREIFEMNTKNNVEDQSVETTGENYTTGAVNSKDGTAISYRELGHGPGVVMLHGTMESSQSHMQLAKELADAFTIFLPDRRSLTLGFPFAKDYSVRKEIEDLEALLTKTGSHNVFGVSSGGIICLQAALTLPVIRKAAIYEPPLSFTRSFAMATLTRFDKEMAQGKVAAAFITAMTASQMGPPVFRMMPRWLQEWLTDRMMKQQEKKSANGGITMKTQAPPLHYDFQLVAEMSERLDSFKEITAEVLLLGGNKSPAYLKPVLDSLEKVLPHVKRVEFPGLDHGGSSDSGNFNKRGNPGMVAKELRRFFV